MAKSEDFTFKTLTRNKKAYSEFHIIDKYEAGIVLLGSEIKSVRGGNVVLKDGYVMFRNGEAWLENVNIGKYEQGGTYFNHEPLRVRKLLLNRREIDSIEGQVSRKGLTVLPLSIYLKGNKAKIEIGTARSKKKYDKKQDIINREAEKQDGLEMKQRSRRLLHSGE